MPIRQIDPRKQFSKKLANRTEWFWFGYMLVLVAALVYRPEADVAIVCLAIITTIVMIVSVLAYTDNSKFDKALYTMRVLNLHKFPVPSKKTEESDDKSEEEEEAEG